MKEGVKYLGVFVYLIIWKLFYIFGCFSILLLLPALLIFKMEFDYRMHKKFCFANCFLDKNNKFYKFLTSKILTFLSSIVFILIMMIVLFIGIIFLDLKDSFILFLDVFLLAFFYQKLNLLSFRDNIRSLFKINVLSFVNALFLVVVFIVVNLLLPFPNFIDKDLVITMKNYSANFYSDCFIINFLVVNMASFYAAEQWLFVKGLFVLKNELLKFILMVLFLGGNFYFFYLFSKFILTFKEIIDGFKFTK